MPWGIGRHKEWWMERPSEELGKYRSPEIRSGLNPLIHNREANVTSCLVEIIPQTLWPCINPSRNLYNPRGQKKLTEQVHVIMSQRGHVHWPNATQYIEWQQYMLPSTSPYQWVARVWIGRWLFLLFVARVFWPRIGSNKRWSHRGIVPHFWIDRLHPPSHNPSRKRLNQFEKKTL